MGDYDRVDDKRKVYRVHMLFSQNYKDLFDHLQKVTGAPKTAIMRIAMEKAYADEYPQFFTDDYDSL